MVTLSQRFSLFIFDLDGTLADTRADITASLNHALAKFERPALSVETVTRFVGDGARVLIERALGAAATGSDVSRVLAAFLDHYRDGCALATRLYPGVSDALERLGDRDLAVLTNKPEPHSRKILRALGIESAFRKIVGGDGPWPKPDPAGLLSIVEDLGVSKDQALFIGDSGVDVATARAAGTRVAFVTYGFRPDAAHEHPPDYKLNCLTDLFREPA